MDPDDSDSPWQDNAESLRDTEWSKISTEFLNVGYREGITAGKESALQEGFDEGFAQTGAPIGHRLGMHRGATAAILSILASRSAIGSIGTVALDEARTILAALADVRVADIAPPDVQAVEHAEEHLKVAEGTVLPGALREKSDMESLESMMARMEATPNDAGHTGHRPTTEEVETLFSRFQLLADTLGLSCPEIQ